MLRLAPRLLSQNTIIPGLINASFEQAYQKHYKVFTKLLSVAPVIIADNIAQYYADSAKQDWGLTGENFPCIAPPFKETWFIEFNEPGYLVLAGGKIRHSIASFKGQGGVLFVNLPPLLAKKMMLNYGGLEKQIDPWLEKSRWIIMTYTAGSTPNGGVVLFPWIQMLFIAENGMLLNNSFLSDCIQPKDVTPQFKDQACASLHVPLLTLGFMHCKNIQAVDVTTEEGPEPKWSRRQRVPQLKYQVLQIDPNFNKKRRTQIETDNNRAGKAFHICRGYFAHYVDNGESTGLFGRGIFGNFWVPSHPRGDLKHGSIISDYNIKSPQD